MKTDAAASPLVQNVEEPSVQNEKSQDLALGKRVTFEAEPDLVGRAKETDEEPAAVELVERTVLQVNALCKKATMDFAMAVGRLVITNLYSGSIASWRERRPDKEHSLRRLAKHPALSMSPSALYQSLAIFELCERLGICSWKHVSTAHLRLVLPLSRSDQESLLHAAEEHKWPTRRLDHEVGELVGRNHRCNERGGRRRSTRLRKQIRTMTRLVMGIDTIVGSGSFEVEPSPDSARLAIQELQCAAEKFSALRRRLERYLVGPETTPPSLAGSEESAYDVHGDGMASVAKGAASGSDDGQADIHKPAAPEAHDDKPRR